jgi:GLPGLI family protein
MSRRADLGVYYKNIREQIKFVQLDFLGFPIIRKDTLIEKYWNLTNKSKIINSFLCKHADITTTNELNGAKFYTEAWYTPDLSLSYGPKGFDGLPGLIVSLETLNLKYILEKIEFLDYHLVIKRPQGKPMSNDEIISYMAKQTGANEEDLKKFFRTDHSKK